MTIGCLGYRDFHYMYKDKTVILYSYWWFLYWLNLTFTLQKGLAFCFIMSIFVLGKETYILPENICEILSLKCEFLYY